MNDTQVEVWEFVDRGEDPIGYYADGHVEPEPFVDAIRKLWKKQTGEEYPEPLSTVVRHVYCRFGPIDLEQEDSDMGMEFSDEPSGGDPVTVMFT